MKTAVHQYEDKLLEFAYGELPAAEAAAVDAHVRGCARCTEALSQIHSVRNTMSQLPRVPAPDAGLESLLAYAEQTAKRNAQQKKQAVWWRRYLMPLASATALLLVGVVAWRASQEFNPDPAMVALEMEKEREAPSAVTSAPVAQAPDPAERKTADIAKSEAVAAGVPAAEPVAGDEGGQVARDNEARQGAGSTEALDEANQKADAPARSKLGMLTEEQQEARGDKAGGKVPLPSKPMPVAKASRSRRDVIPADAPTPETKTADQPLADDFSNAAQRGAFKQVPPAPPAKPGPQPPPDTTAELSKNQNVPGTQAVWGPKSTPGFGLGTGSVGTSGGGGAEDSKPNAEATSGKRQSADKLTERVAEKKSRAPAEEPAREEAAQQPYAQVPPLPPAAPPSPAGAPVSRGSMSLPKGLSSGVSARSSLDEEDGAVLRDTDALAVNKDAEFAARTQAELRQKNLAAAREAANRNDRLGEVKYAQAVLSAGAKGAERLEALKRLCDAYEAMGEYDRAQLSCEALLKEFPNTVAAQEVAQRRSRMQKSPAPAKARATERSYDFEGSAPDQAKEPPKPAEAAPAY